MSVQDEINDIADYLKAEYLLWLYVRMSLDYLQADRELSLNMIIGLF